MRYSLGNRNQDTKTLQVNLTPKRQFPIVGALGEDPNVVERDSIRNLGSEKNVDMNPYQMQDPIYEHIKKAARKTPGGVWERLC